MWKKRLGAWVKDNPWKIVHIIAAVGLYLVITFLTATLLGSQSQGIYRTIFTIMGALFEITSISILVEAVRGRKGTLYLISVLFMIVSFIGAALGMLSSWQASVQASKDDPIEIQRTYLKGELERLKGLSQIELKRLEQGDSKYMTDAENTRRSLRALEEDIARKTSELASLPSVKAEDLESVGGYFAAIPLSPTARLVAELLFRVFIAALLQVGGFVTITFLARGQEHGKKAVPKAPGMIPSKDGTIHFAECTDKKGIYRTSCGRLIKRHARTPEHVVCPECLKLSTEVPDEDSVLAS